MTRRERRLNYSRKKYVVVYWSLCAELHIYYQVNELQNNYNDFTEKIEEMKDK